MTCHWLDFEQSSPEWLQARCGILTASKGMDMSSMLKNGGESAKRTNLKNQLLVERFTGCPKFVYQNAAMKWGTEQEPNAREAYSLYTGATVVQVGLAISDEIEFFGASPDGLVGAEGLIEIKCPESETFLKWVLDGVVPDQHKPQMLAQLAVTGRQWCDFVAYDPRFPLEQDLFIRRFTPYPADIQKIKDSARTFLAEVAVMERAFLGARFV